MDTVLFLTLAQVISAVIFWKDIVLIIYYPLTVSIYECWCWRYVLFRMKRRFWQIKVWNSNSESFLSFLFVCSHCYVTDRRDSLSDVFLWRQITSVSRAFWYANVNYPSVYIQSFISVTFIIDMHFYVTVATNCWGLTRCVNGNDVIGHVPTFSCFSISIFFFNLTPWSESASELYRPSDRRLSAKWLPTFADRGCHVVSVSNPYPDNILCQYEVEVNLRPTVSRPVCPGVRRLSGTCDQFFFRHEISCRQLRLCYFVAPSLTRGRVCHLLLNFFWVLPEQSLLSRSPAELTAIFYCLIWDSPNLEGQVPVFISPRKGSNAVCYMKEMLYFWTCAWY
jgi:hypothetical protein